MIKFNRWGRAFLPDLKDGVSRACFDEFGPARSKVDLASGRWTLSDRGHDIIHELTGAGLIQEAEPHQFVRTELGNTYPLAAEKFIRANGGYGAVVLTADHKSDQSLPEPNEQAFPEDLIEQVHVSQIKPGDTVILDGVQRTVCAKDLGRDELMGHTLFGDSHRIGTDPVTRIIFAAERHRQQPRLEAPKPVSNPTTPAP